MRPIRPKAVKWTFDSRGSDKVTRLGRSNSKQGWGGQPQTRLSGLPAPEVPHIGIHCLAAGDGKKYGSKDRKANYGCRMRQKVQCVIWTERG